MKIWVSLAIVIVFLLLFLSGLLLYVLPYNAHFYGIHIITGFAFTAVVALHFRNNFASLLRYLQRKNALLKVSLIAGGCGALIIAVIYRLTPVTQLLDYSHKLKSTAIVVESKYQTLLIHSEADDSHSFTIEVRAGEHYRGRHQAFHWGKTISSPPQMVFWLEDMQGKHLKTLYVTAKTGYPFIFPNDKVRTDLIARQESFPYWLHKWKSGSAVSQLDALTGATPNGHFSISSKSPEESQQFQVLAEVNRSFDFNDYYTKDKFPDDPVYSGSGNPGQPSIIYSATINLNADDNVFVMKPIGHGHPSGANGDLYTEMEGIDSALSIIQRMLVEINR